jgi:hypothetical protein
VSLTREAHVNTLELLAIVDAVLKFGLTFFCNSQVLVFGDLTTMMSEAAHGFVSDNDDPLYGIIYYR